MIEFVLFSLPALVYVFIAQSQGQPPQRTLDVLGLRPGTPSGYLVGLLLTVVLWALAWAAIQVVPTQALGSPLVVPQAIGVVALLMTVLRAAAEELLFRGLIAGLLFTGMGFARGNAIQAVAFLLPHLGLLAVDAGFWPLLVVQFAVGWLLGWLRHRTGSIGPGVLAHALSNIGTALLLTL